MTLEEKIRRFDELTAQADELVQQAKLLGEEIKAEQGLIDRNDPISKYLSAYFSNEQAAKECAAWLNELCAKGGL